MKKIILVIITFLFTLIASYLIGTGFRVNPDVILSDYSISEDGTQITMHVGGSFAIGYIRGFKDHGGGEKPHYLSFYYAFGGLNGSWGAQNTFTLELAPDDTEIYFKRPGGYELVLVKDEETGQWSRPPK